EWTPQQPLLLEPGPRRSPAPKPPTPLPAPSPTRPERPQNASSSFPSPPQRGSRGPPDSRDHDSQGPPRIDKRAHVRSVQMTRAQAGLPQMIGTRSPEYGR